MKAVKAAVILMGILILVGFAVVIVTLIRRAGGDPALEAGFGKAEIAMPAGAEIAETVIGDGRLAIRFTLPDGRSQYRIVDIESGVDLGSIDIVPEPPR